MGVAANPNNDGADDVGKETPAPYECEPNGRTQCLYKKAGKTYFKLLCECGLNDQEADGRAKGYCPMPGPDDLKARIKWMRAMWIGDNCHTYDRHVFVSQLECGIG